ncbi:hypothetical protein ACFWBH_07655 [Streptomyces sp. NPDC059999]|uniref:hypothetical protein n=1 Tax=Streptomyces sp. NPDC059999 TaxID=3347030 RepID=UPI0036C9B3ED
MATRKAVLGDEGAAGRAVQGVRVSVPDTALAGAQDLLGLAVVQQEPQGAVEETQWAAAEGKVQAVLGGLHAEWHRVVRGGWAGAEELGEGNPHSVLCGGMPRVVVRGEHGHHPGHRSHAGDAE